MHNAKALLFFPLLFLIGSTFQSCKLDPPNPDAGFWDSEQNLIQVVGGIYSHMNGSEGYAASYLLVQELLSDEAIFLDRLGNCSCDLQELHPNQFGADNEAVYQAWTFIFEGIRKCNTVIAQVDDAKAKGEAQPALVDPYQAEAKALRALFYYWALDLFGNVPIITEAGVIPEVGPANSSRTEVYQFVEREIQATLPLLPKTVGQATYARMHYYAAQALLVKLYLNAPVYNSSNEYLDVITAANEILGANAYNLEVDFFANFDADNTSSSENIFVVPYDAQFAEGLRVAELSLHQNSRKTFNLGYAPLNQLASLEHFYSLFDSLDMRRGQWGNQQVRGSFLAGPQYEANRITPILDNPFYDDNPDPDGPEVVFTPEINDFTAPYQQAGVRISKYEIQKEGLADMNPDVPVFRLSDIMLSQAEALFRFNSTSTDALNLVNQVRKRAGLANLNQLTEEDLLAERGRELFFEGVRRQDLIRFGKYGDSWEFKGATPPCRELLPIPEQVLNANSRLQQNPCY